MVDVRDVVLLAAQLVLSGTDVEIASLWEISPEFAKNRKKFLAGDLSRSPKFFLELAYGLRGTAVDLPTGALLDHALLVAAMAVSLDEEGTLQYRDAFEIFFCEPLAKADTLSELKALVGGELRKE